MTTGHPSILLRRALERDLAEADYTAAGMAGIPEPIQGKAFFPNGHGL